MPLELVAWLSLGFLSIVILHELTHVLVARLHGHRLVCVAVNPIGAAVVIEDRPTQRYALCQVVLPMLVTAALTYPWLYVLLAHFPPVSSAADLQSQVDRLPWLTLGLAALTSGGDIVGSLLSARRPLVGRERVLRDLRFLRRVPGLVRFTSYGRDHWHADWIRLGPVRRDLTGRPVANPLA